MANRHGKQSFDGILSELEAVTGWQTERVNRPVQILGSLDGVETGVRQLRRSRPLETTTMEVGGHSVLLPTLPEVLRIKAFLVVDRNAARDYLDLAALSSHIGIDKAALSLWRMDELYPQKNDDAWAVRSQLIMQLAAPRPYDLDKVNLAEYKGVKAPFDRWESIAALCGKVSDSLLELCRENLTATPSAGAQQAITKIVSWREAQGSPQPLPLPKLPGLKS